MHRFVWFLALWCCSLVNAQNLRYKAVFYHPYQGGFLQLLSDDTGPRRVLIQTIDQNFHEIASALQANAVIIRCVDEGEYVGESGGGFPYNPASPNDQKPQMAVAQEIVLDIAKKWGLKVFFTVEPSYFHRLVSDQEPAVNATGAFNFIRSIINPAQFYRRRSGYCATHLEDIGLPNTCIHSYQDDPRVAGFIFDSEESVYQNSTQRTAWLNKYWPFFYFQVHQAYDARRGHWAMMYAGGSPASTGIGAPSWEYESIKTLKQFFSNNSQPKPDMFGFEWYGTAGWDIGAFVEQAIAAYTTIDPAYEGDYAVPVDHVFMSEGATQNWKTGTMEYYIEAVYAAAHAGVPMVTSWATDAIWEAWQNAYPLVTDSAGNFLTERQGDNLLDLFQFSIYDEIQNPAPYPASPEGFWNPDCSTCVFPDDYWSGVGYNSKSNPKNVPDFVTFPLSFGFIRYTQLTSNGEALREAFANGGNVSFYAYPDPAEPDANGLAPVTLHWLTTSASQVQIRLGAPDGAVVATGDSSGEAEITQPVADGTMFYLDDLSGKVLSSTRVVVAHY